MKFSLSEKASLVGPFDYAILKTLYSFKDKREFVQLPILKEKLDIKNNEELKITLTKLNNLKLIYKSPTELAYKLTFAGLDILAIKMLYLNKSLNKLAEVIGEGKESIVYYGYDFSENQIAVKFHRVGTKRYKRSRINRDVGKKSWISITVENAKREYNALECVFNEGGYVPRPLGNAYNAVAMEYIKGSELNRVKNENLNLKEIFDEILQTLRIAYTICKVTHGDLSPYNILIDEKYKPYIIDWPQATYSEERLKSDIINIIKFFNKFKIDTNFQQVFNYVRGVL